MKVRVNKKWWQFWLPEELEVYGVGLERQAKPLQEELNDDYRHMLSVDDNGFLLNPNGNRYTASAIEADEAEPWYGGDAVEDEDSSVVTAEPPIVYANRGNARMEERRQTRDKM